MTRATAGVFIGGGLALLLNSWIMAFGMLVPPPDKILPRFLALALVTLVFVLNTIGLDPEISTARKRLGNFIAWLIYCAAFGAGAAGVFGQHTDALFVQTAGALSLIGFMMLAVPAVIPVKWR